VVWCVVCVNEKYEMSYSYGQSGPEWNDRGQTKIIQNKEKKEEKRKKEKKKKTKTKTLHGDAMAEWYYGSVLVR